MRRAVVLSASSFAVLGACLTIPGTLLPVLVEAFGIRLVEAGSMLALQPVGFLLSVVAAAPLIRRAGMRVALSVALAASAVGYAVFGCASSWVVGAAGLLVAGLGFGLMEVATNTLLIRVGGARRANVLNLAHLFFGVGAFVAPVLVARAVAAGASWRVAFGVAAALAAAVALGWSFFDEHAAAAAGDDAETAATTTVASNVRADQSSAAAAAPSLPLVRPQGWRSRLAALLATLLALYVGLENGIGAWLTAYLVGARAMSLADAGTGLSLYWLGLTAGRLALTFVAHRLQDEQLLVALTIATFAALAGALLAPTPASSVLCFGAVGLGLSGIFPTAMALGGRRHPDDAAGVASLLVAGAGLGGIIIPWTMSAIADGAGVAPGMGFYVGVAVLQAGCSVAVALAARTHRE